MSTPTMSAAQVSALRYQIHAFEFILKGWPIPDVVLQCIKSFSVIDASYVSTEEVAENSLSLQVNSKLNLNKELIMCVPLYFCIIDQSSHLSVRRCIELQPHLNSIEGDFALNLSKLRVNLVWLAAAADEGL